MMTQATKLRNAYGGLPRRAQLTILAIGVITIVVMMVVVRAATHTTWVPVSQKLEASEKTEAQETLEAADIESRISESTGEVEVPKEASTKASAALASAGIAVKSTCSAVFGEESGLAASTSAKEAQQARTCRENELAKQLEDTAGVQSADVKLTMPEDTLFSEDQMPAMATVTIDTGGATLDEKQAQSLVSIVSSGASGLARENVTLVDQNGTDLNPLTNEGAGGMDAATMKMRLESMYNAKIEADLTQQMEAIAGEGKVKVFSDAELDVDQIQREVRDYGGEDNEKGIVEGEDFKYEILNQEGEATGGVTGVTNNINGDDETGAENDNRAVTALNDADDAGTAGYQNGEGSTKYAIDAVAEKITVAPGTVKRDKLSVVVDKSVPGDSASALKNIAMTHTGVDPEDSVNFSVAKIASLSEKKSTTSELLKPMGTYLKYLLLGLGMIGMAFFLRRTLNQRTQELLYPMENPLQLDPGFEPVPLRELEAAVAAASTFDNQKRLELERRVETVATEKPQEVAQMLRSWLHDQEQQTYAGGSRR